MFQVLVSDKILHKFPTDLRFDTLPEFCQASVTENTHILKQVGVRRLFIDLFNLANQASDHHEK